MTPSRKLLLAYLSMYAGLAICAATLLVIVVWIVVAVIEAGGWLVVVGIVGVAMLLGGAFTAMDIEAKRTEGE